MATYNLYLLSIEGANKVNVIRLVAEIKDITRSQAKTLIDNASYPLLLKEYTDKELAKSYLAQLTSDDVKAKAYVENLGIDAVSGYTFSIRLIDSYTQEYYNFSVAYATVKLYNREDGKFITSGKTDAGGRFTYSVSSSDSGYIDAPNYAIIEKLRFISINKTSQWKTVSTSVTENAYALSTSQYLQIYMKPKGFIYFKPKYYDKSDFKVKDYTGTILLSCYHARMGHNITSSLSLPSAITQDTDGYYYPAVTDPNAYINILYRLIDTGEVYFKLAGTDPSATQGGDATPTIYFYPYGIFNSTGATDYNLNSRLTFYPSQKALRISDIRQCYVSEYTHLVHKPNSNNEYYKSTFCPNTTTIIQNYYQNTAYYGNKLPYSERLQPYSTASLKIVLCVYENETYMYNGNAPTQYGGAKVTLQTQGLIANYNNISAVTSTYTSLTITKIYYTSKIKITLSDISAGLTFEKEKENFYFIPGMTEIRFNAYKNGDSKRTIQVSPYPVSYNRKKSASLAFSCLEGNFERDVTLTCKWKSTGSTTQTFTFTVPSSSDTYNYTLPTSVDLDYNDTNWSMSFANPSQALADGYVNSIDIIKETQDVTIRASDNSGGGTLVNVFIANQPTDIDLIFSNEYGEEERHTMYAETQTQEFELAIEGTITLDIPSPTDAFYYYEYIE